MTVDSWILEKHISKKALPNENIISWAKWDPKLSVKNIVLKFEPDVAIEKVLNVAEEALQDNDFESGKITIEKEHLQIPGFFGFTGFYMQIPENEITINFVVEITFEETIKKIEYSTKIIRPILEFQQTEYTLTSSQFATSMSPLNLALVNTGSGRPINLKPFADLSNTPDMDIKIQTKIEEIKDESLIFVKTNKIAIPKVVVSGKGFGMLSMGYEYQDTMGNSYKSKLANLSISIEEKQTLQVPITENITKSLTPLLQATA